jgi:hypothetical protein
METDALARWLSSPPGRAAGTGQMLWISGWTRKGLDGCGSPAPGIVE